MRDAMAKIRLIDGREVWRVVTVRYRDVQTGLYLSTGEVERLSMVDLAPEALPDKQRIMRDILTVQSEIAADPQAGSKGTSAGRLVMQILKSIGKDAGEDSAQEPWFVLGRELAKVVSTIIAESSQVEFEE